MWIDHEKTLAESLHLSVLLGQIGWQFESIYFVFHPRVLSSDGCFPTDALGSRSAVDEVLSCSVGCSVILS